MGKNKAKLLRPTTPFSYDYRDSNTIGRRVGRHLVAAA